MICQECKAENREEAKYCGVCGKSLFRKMKCPYCLEEIMEGAKKCKHCGSSLDSNNTKTEILPKHNTGKEVPADEKSIICKLFKFSTSWRKC